MTQSGKRLSAIHGKLFEEAHNKKKPGPEGPGIIFMHSQIQVHR